ncbi:receptor like protein 7 [Populus alba x Populus x berolinensis]|nr:receptor like protein 7 [Populus alba x Populus x berolinensis]
MQPLCHDDEGHALLQLKESLVINESASYEPSAYPKVASWKADGERGNCCSWDGVECDGDSGHVIGLNLSSSCLYGSIDSNSSLFHLVQLRRLNLADNDFNNSEIPSEIRNLSMSGFTDLVEALTNLEVLHLIGVNISAKIPQIMTNLSSLSSLSLRDCGLQGEFPMGIFQLPNLRMFSIRWVVPSSLGNLTQLFGLFLSDNKLHGAIPESIYRLQNLEILDLSTIYEFKVSDNKLNGEIPEVICNLTSLSVLDLSNNNLSGKLPPCLGNKSSTVSVLNLRNNSFSGDIPETFTSGCSLRVVDLSQNKLEGKIPKSLANCTKLEILSLEQNNINDVFPSWLGMLPDLKVLILRCNGLHGVIGKPETNVEFPRLQIVDLSNNSFKGKLPLEYFRNWIAMKNADTSIDISRASVTNPYPYSMTMTNKGVMILYEKIQDSLTAIDLSSNGFEGGIPEVLGDLKALHLLNLSNNFLSGRIPPSLSNLKELEALDLSQNKLSGEIPVQLAQLTFLEIFNVSHNFLSGSIPRGNQFGAFDNTSFDANSGLCGEPLSKKCRNGEDPLPAPKEDEGSGYPLEFGWKVVVIGYATGLLIGVILGCVMNTRKYEWVVKNYFARWQNKGQYLKNRLRRS